MANSRGMSVEFIVKPREDLYLEGSLRKLPRVIKGEPYPCQMQKSQAFSCLFRHYAKHNGLRKEDLVFYFVDELLPDQTPESVHLMSQDEIWVEHRKPEEKADISKVDQSIFFHQFQSLLNSPIHSDITFLIGEEKIPIQAHKAILSIRSEYFGAMFKLDGMKESEQNTIIVKEYDYSTFHRMLEYIYTNTIKSLETTTCTTDDIIKLFTLANQYCMLPLQQICEILASHILNHENIGRFTLLTFHGSCDILKEECKKFLYNNLRSLRDDETFRSEIESSPQLALFVFDAWAGSSSGDSHEINTISHTNNTMNHTGNNGENNLKRRRVSTNNSATMNNESSTTPININSTHVGLDMTTTDILTHEIMHVPHHVLPAPSSSTAPTQLYTTTATYIPSYILSNNSHTNTHNPN